MDFAADPNRHPQWIAVAEDPPDEGLVHDDDRRRAGAIAHREVAARQDARAEGGEPLGADEVHVDRAVGSRERRTARHLETARRTSAGDRNNRRVRRPLDAGDGGRTVADAVEDRQQRVRSDGTWPTSNGDGQHPVGVEAEIERCERGERTDEQARRHHERERQTDLRDDQRVPDDAPPGSEQAAALAQRVVGVPPR
jgi:hypothetical protein